ncbi:MAG: hypothetical protein CMM61_08170 [Rhodospirillaceae bacterium]|nr:hypothetical protein [Rhodospirillaceae bacterium]|tara:strand:+ start:77 stop:304 length:228 start_codon:yes stop_codon:yes gene_type:complete
MPAKPATQEIYLVPKDGLPIPTPKDGGTIPPEGAWVPNNRFYRNYIRRGEAERGTPPKATPQPAAKAPENSKDKD